MAVDDIITGKDILLGLMSDVHEAPGSDYEADAKRYIREAYWQILGLHPWSWALASTPYTITTKPAIPVNVISLNSGANTTVVCDQPISGGDTGSVVGYKFVMDANQTAYRIVTHSPGSVVFILSGGYTDPQLTGPGKLFLDEYLLPPTVMRIWDPLYLRGVVGMYGSGEINLLDKTAFERTYGRGFLWTSHIPEAACEVHPSGYNPSTKGVVRRIRLAPITEEPISLDFDYTEFHNLDFSGSDTETDTPRVPREFRHVIYEIAQYKSFLIKDERLAEQSPVKAALTIRQMEEAYPVVTKSSLQVRPQHSLVLGMNEYWGGYW